MIDADTVASRPCKVNNITAKYHGFLYGSWYLRCQTNSAYNLLIALKQKGMSGILPVDDLASEMKISRRRLFIQLARLEEAGVITRRRGFRCTWYTITTDLSRGRKVNNVALDNINHSLITDIDQGNTNMSTTSITGSKTLHTDSKSDNGVTSSVCARESYPSGEQWEFNHPALRDILNDIELPFQDDYENLEMRCFMDRSCWEHQKPTLALRCTDGSKVPAGVWRCFRCGRRGYIDQLVRAWTGWGVFKTGLYLLGHQAYDDPHDDVKRTYVPVVDADLRQYRYRHVYCYERKLDEETCLRYELGFDQRDWMITMPVRNAAKMLVAIKKRAASGKVFQYLPTENHEYTIYGIQYVKDNDIVWLCEGEFDAMFVDQTLRRYGFTNQSVVALMGKELSERVLPQMVEKNPSLFVIATDNDEEGIQAAAKLRSQLHSIAPCIRMRYEDEQTKDPNASSEAHLAAQARRAQQSLAQEKETINA